MCGNSKVSVNVPSVTEPSAKDIDTEYGGALILDDKDDSVDEPAASAVEHKEYDVDLSADGLEFLLRTDDHEGVEPDYDYFDESEEQYEVYHELALMQLALQLGSAIISEDGKTATLTITVPIVERG